MTYVVRWNVNGTRKDYFIEFRGWQAKWGPRKEARRWKTKGAASRFAGSCWPRQCFSVLEVEEKGG
jgi:hypothetical protein